MLQLRQLYVRLSFSPRSLSLLFLKSRVRYSCGGLFLLCSVFPYTSSSCGACLSSILLPGNDPTVCTVQLVFPICFFFRKALEVAVPVEATAAVAAVVSPGHAPADSSIFLSIVLTEDATAAVASFVSPGYAPAAVASVVSPEHAPAASPRSCRRSQQT
jgi:hypothetical protein